MTTIEELNDKMIEFTVKMILNPRIYRGTPLWVNFTYDEAEREGVLHKPYWEDLRYWDFEDVLRNYKGGRYYFFVSENQPPDLAYNHETRSERFSSVNFR